MRRITSSTFAAVTVIAALAAPGPVGASVPGDLLEKAGCVSGHDGLRCPNTTENLRTAMRDTAVCQRRSTRYRRSCVRRVGNPLAPTPLGL